MEIKRADLILTKGSGWVSEVIKEVTNSPYSHATGYVKENELIEAQGFRAIGYQALDYYSGIGDIYTCDILSDEQRQGIVDYVTKSVGWHYNYLLLFWELIRYVFHVSLPYKGDFDSRICSSLWADAYKSVGIDLCPGIKYPSPADLSNSKLLRQVGSI